MSADSLVRHDPERTAAALIDLAEALLQPDCIAASAKSR